MNAINQSDLQPWIDNVQALADARSRGVVGAHEQLAEAIGQLQYAAQTPWEVLWDGRFQILNILCRRMAIEMGLLDAIAKRQGSHVTSKQLAEATQYDKQAIERVMRVLTNTHIFAEVGENTYAANEVTVSFSTREGIASERYFFDFLFPIGANIIPCLRSNGLQQSNGQTDQTPFQHTFGAPIFDYLNRPENVEAKQIFDSNMHGRRRGLHTHWFDVYPAEKELLGGALVSQTIGDGINGCIINDGTINGDTINSTEINGTITNGHGPNGNGSTAHRSNVLLVDIAGNKGHDLQAFQSAFRIKPGQLILEDLPITFENIEKLQLDALDSAGIVLQEYDFFTPQPIRGAKAYFFRDICHDWMDCDAQRFLSRTAEAMTPGYSRLLIEDHVVDDVGAHHRQATSDVLMLLVLTGIERTRAQWYALLESAGLEIVKIWPGKRGHQSVIEAVRSV